MLLNVKSQQLVMAACFLLWGVALYSLPPIIQPYTTSLLVEFSNSFSLLFAGCSIGGFVCCLAETGSSYILRSFLRVLRLPLLFIGLFASMILILMNYDAYIMVNSSHFGADISRFMLLFAGYGSLSCSALAAFLSGLGLACLCGMAAIRAQEKVNIDSPAVANH